MRFFKLFSLICCALCLSGLSAEAQTTFFSENCGTTAPTTSPRPTPDSYTGWKNYGVSNIKFAGTADVRATSYDNSHVWFASGSSRTLSLSGINTSSYHDIKLSFTLKGGSTTTVNATDFFSVTCTDASGKNYSIALPTTLSTSQSAWVAVTNLSGLPATSSLTITFTGSSANSTGLRMDDISLSGTVSSSTDTDNSSSTDSVDFKITTLNSEWLSCSEYGPTNETLQINNIASLIKTINPDVIALQEVGTSASYASMDTLVKRLGSEWACSIVPWNADNCSQNQGIVYKKSKVQLSNTLLMTSAGLSYNWSSGRYPALYEVNLVAGTTLYPISLINIHAKASSDATSYSRRQAASLSLKALLDGSSYSARNVVLLGDYNDYLVGTQCSSCSSSGSPYKNFVEDAVNYKGLTESLTDPSYSSPVIDNIIISNELFSAYVSNSVLREVAATQTISNYSTTTSDHTPISAVFRFKSSVATNLDEQNARSGSIFYPNPTKGYIFIVPAEALRQITVTTLTGMPILILNGYVDKIDLSALAPGAYLVRVSTATTNYVQKILKY